MNYAKKIEKIHYGFLNIHFAIFFAKLQLMTKYITGQHGNPFQLKRKDNFAKNRQNIILLKIEKSELILLKICIIHYGFLNIHSANFLAELKHQYQNI